MLPPFTHLCHVAEIFKPLNVSLGASLKSRLSPYSWLLRLVSTPNGAKGGRPYYVTKDNLLSEVMLNWMSYLGVWDLTYGQSKMTRYENKRTKAQCWDTIYVYNKKITSAFRMESKYKQYACMCLEWMFCDCLLVCFKLNVKYELIKLGKGGTPDIPKSTWSMSKTKPSQLSTINMWGEWSLCDYCS